MTLPPATTSRPPVAARTALPRYSLFGLSHHTAPVEVREPYAIPAARLEAEVRGLMAEPGVAEAMVLSTCNRSEILLVGELEAGRRFLARRHGWEAGSRPPYFYELEGEAAIRHVFRVAASLDSQIVGEPQILGQYKAALAAAEAAGGARGGLRSLLARAFHAAKRARSETSLARQPVSISQAAVDLARRIFGRLEDKVVLLAGAGEMGAQAAAHLMERGAGRLIVASRTRERAERVAAKFSGEAILLADLLEHAPRADVIIACSGAAASGGERPLLTAAEARAVLARRRHQPQLWLDIAVPRDIDPRAGDIENAFLYNIDDLQTTVDENRSERQREAARAELIIASEVERFLRQMESAAAAPTIQALEARCEQIRREQLERWRSGLGPLSAAQWEGVEALTRALMRRWLHQPLIEIKAAAAEGQDLALLESAARLFALSLEKELGDSAPKNQVRAAAES